MVGWYRITYNTNGWADNKDVILNGIKSVVDSLDKTSSLVNFFFFNYDNEIKFTFYGNKSKVMDKFNSCLQGRTYHIDKWRPKKTKWRFEEDYPLGVKLFEIGSRLALCSIDNKLPKDISSHQDQPITYVLRHVYLQNLGYNKFEEGSMSPFIDLPLLGLYHFLGIKIK